MVSVPSAVEAAVKTKGTTECRRKVKTGCTTCKIRRIKCDEAKPACVRCTSTGRKCDGYDINANPRSRKNKALTEGIPYRLQTCAAITSVIPTISRPASIPRPLIADISGTEVERYYFHCFRNIAGQVVGIRHKYNTMFWNETVPQYCYEVDAMKHAFIALGAAYHNFQTTGERVDYAAPPSRTERFIIQHYSLAMKELAQDTQQVSVRKRYGMTLIGCIAFFCIEMLRNDWQAALTHLSNGLHLMANLPEELSGVLNNPGNGSHGSHARVSYMLRLLSRWEVAMRLVTGDFRPLLTLQVYENRKLDTSAGTDTSSLDGIFEAVDSYCQDASAFAWLTRDHKGDSCFWMQNRPSLQHFVLLERSRLIGDNIQSYENSSDMKSLPIQDVIFFHASKLRHKGGTLVLKMLRLPEKPDAPLDVEELRQFEDFIHTACDLRDIIVSSSAEQQAGDNSNVGLAVVPTLYVTGNCCRDEHLRKRILELVMEWPQREHLWDGSALRHMLDVNGIRPTARRISNVMMEPGHEEADWDSSLPGMYF